ncbi:MAG: cysteine desulfurase [Candidatus Thermoplasmatota archaeon]|nr:cysteine desulfurase [Candidatus Thermoplasmatota archaeon]
MSFDPEAVRRDIPLLDQDDPPIYFDNACMTLKPRPVIQALTRYYEETPVCAGRSTYKLTAQVDRAVGSARAAVARFLGASRPEECVFLRNTTEAINLVAHGLDLPDGSTVLTTDREHNSNLVPWQRRAQNGLRHEAVASTQDEQVDLDALEARLSQGDVSLVSVVHMSNLDGYVAPVKEIAELAHDHGALVLVDGAQYAPHAPVDVQELGADLYAFSVHKMMGPTGVGVLYGRYDLLETMDPLVVGGSTIQDTTLDAYTLRDPPGRFEAGLQDFAGILATEATVDYLEALDLAAVHRHEGTLSTRLQDGLEALGATTYGSPAARGNGIVSFSLPGLDIHQLAILLEDKANVLVRAGLHCLNSWFNARELQGSCRASLYAYNTMAEVEACLEAVEAITKAIR